MKRKNITPWFVILLLLLSIIPFQSAAAATAAVVSIGSIDYDNLTMQVYYNNNSIVYYSTDKSNWTEVDGSYSSSTGSCIMDISWVSATSDVTLYFKGDVITTIKSITVPMQNSDFSVTYDKSEGDFTFNGTGDAEYFQWRKATDYSWTKVSFDEASAAYIKFMAAMEKLRMKGASIIFRLPQVAGTGIGDAGNRPSIEDTAAITARAAAPTVKVNSSKLTMNTTTAMEYYNSSNGMWVECDNTMTLEDIAPKVLYANGASTVTLQIRKAATDTLPYSKTQYLTVSGQTSAPTIGGNTTEVTYYYLNSKLVLQFNQASASNTYEYAVVKAGSSFSVSGASWKSVTSSKLLTLTNQTVPDKSTIYIRRKGTDANTSTNTPLKLASAINSFTVTY